MKKGLLFLVIASSNFIFSQTTTTPENLVQQQVDGYNARNIEMFLAPYSDDVEIYDFPNTLNGKGKAEIRPGYEKMFSLYPNLHCEVVNRIVLGNTVIDQERVTGITGRAVLEAVAIYTIENNTIVKVHFIPKN